LAKKEETVFDVVERRRFKAGVTKRTAEAHLWYIKNLRKLREANPNRMLRDEEKTFGSMPSGNMFMGNMFMYIYDAKTKKKLPYWDRFPLVIPIYRKNKTFLGMNLHYLPLWERAVLFNRLLALSSTKSLTPKTRIRATYELLNDAAQYKFFKPTVKRYYFSHIKSRVLRIPPDEWDVALFLPAERFQKETKETVWKDSRRKF
jgi:hypothetical protein